MYAVVKAGAHQYRVQEGDTITIDLQEGKTGDKVTLGQVMLVGGSKISIGAPFIKGAKIEATIKEQSHNPKVMIFKYKRRKNYKRTRGHKQAVTVLHVDKIVGI